MTLSTAYWCVLIAALLPYLWVGIAKAAGDRYDNRDPRGWLARQTSARTQRGVAAQLNAFEAFPAFAAGVVLAHIAGVEDARIALFAIVFVVARVLHGIFYLMGQALLRSLVWMIGIACAAALIAQAAIAVG
jgi:uncharacterized MAPEG superfamily protein